MANPYAPAPRVPVAAGAPGDGQRWSWTETIVAGTTEPVLDLVLPQGETHVLVYQVTGQAGTITITEQTDRASTTYDVHVGDGDGDEVRVSGTVRATATAPPEGDVTVRMWLREGSQPITPLPNYDSIALALTSAAGAPGPWIDSNVFAGYRPERRAWVDVYCHSAVDLSLLDRNGIARRAIFVCQGHRRIYHPARYRLQVRHPGGSAPPTDAVFAWHGGA